MKQTLTILLATIGFLTALSVHAGTVDVGSGSTGTTALIAGPDTEPCRGAAIVAAQIEQLKFAYKLMARNSEVQEVVTVEPVAIQRDPKGSIRQGNFDYIVSLNPNKSGTIARYSVTGQEFIGKCTHVSVKNIQ